MNAKQQLFVAEYLIDLNATQAAIRAGYSERTAYSQGERLLKNVEVSEAIDIAKGKRLERTETKSDQILVHLDGMRVSDVADGMNESGEWKPIHEWPLHLRDRIISLSVEEIWEGPRGEREHVGNVTKVSLLPKDKIIALEGKHVDCPAFVERKELAITTGRAKRLAAAMSRTQDLVKGEDGIYRQAGNE